MTAVVPMIDKATGRAVKEWIGATPDAKVPDRVRLRVLRRYDHKCYLTSIIIADGQTFDLEHIKPLEEGGEHRESNLAPVLRLPHEIKTAAERKRQEKADRIAKRAHGIKPENANKIQSAGFPKYERVPKNGAAKIDKSCLPKLPPRELYR